MIGRATSFAYWGVDVDLTPVRKCVCTNITFAELKQIGITSVEAAAAMFGCGTHCGSCRPYIQWMIETGETELPIIPLDLSPSATKITG
ncbi:MAG: (2Fe-2S)-binding protein [Fimbriimonas sp.]